MWTGTRGNVELNAMIFSGLTAIPTRPFRVKGPFQRGPRNNMSGFFPHPPIAGHRAARRANFAARLQISRRVEKRYMAYGLLARGSDAALDRVHSMLDNYDRLHRGILHKGLQTSGAPAGDGWLQ
jgi:hypothetical protein